MSKYGMLGLLEGMGSSMSKTGDAITKNALVAAQDQREANRERLRQEFAKKESDANYTRSRTDQLADQKTALERDDLIRKENRTNQLTDQKTALQNRDPSAFMEKVNFYDEKLKNKEISQDQYNTALGLSKSTGLTTDQQIKYRLQANEQASVEILGKDPMQPATPEQVKAIETRASQIFNQATGGNSNGDGLLEVPQVVLPPAMVNDVAKAIAGASPEEKAQEVADFKAKGVSDQQIAEIEQKAKALEDKKKEAEDAKAAKGTKRIVTGSPGVMNDPGTIYSKQPPVRKFSQSQQEMSSGSRKSIVPKQPW